MRRQKLVAWEPVHQVSGITLFVGDLAISSPEHQQLKVGLSFQTGELFLHFNNVRAFRAGWDGDPDPFMTVHESSQGPSWLTKVEESRWLASDYFTLDIESSDQISESPWEHFFILASERSIHIAARDDVEAKWISKN